MNIPTVRTWTDEYTILGSLDGESIREELAFTARSGDEKSSIKGDVKSPSASASGRGYVGPKQVDRAHGATATTTTKPRLPEDHPTARSGEDDGNSKNYTEYSDNFIATARSDPSLDGDSKNISDNLVITARSDPSQDEKGGRADVILTARSSNDSFAPISAPNTYEEDEFVSEGFTARSAPGKPKNASFEASVEEEEESMGYNDSFADFEDDDGIIPRGSERSSFASSRQARDFIIDREDALTDNGEARDDANQALIEEYLEENSQDSGLPQASSENTEPFGTKKMEGAHRQWMPDKPVVSPDSPPVFTRQRLPNPFPSFLNTATHSFAPAGIDAHERQRAASLQSHSLVGLRHLQYRSASRRE